MPQYYNFSDLSSGEGLISFWSVLSDMSNYWFGLFLLTVIFLIPLITMIQRGEDVLKAFHISSLYTAITGTIFYVTGIIPSSYSLAIYLPALIYVVTLGLRIYNKQT